MTDRLPHEDYIDDVCERLGDQGIEVADGITTTPDGQTLDAAISFAPVAIDPEAWDDGVHLTWDQNSGWALCTEGSNRSLYPLDLAAYSSPVAVARRTATRLAAAPDSWVDEEWDGADDLETAINAWEAGQ